MIESVNIKQPFLNYIHHCRTVSSSQKCAVQCDAISVSVVIIMYLGSTPMTDAPRMIYILWLNISIMPVIILSRSFEIS